MATNKLVIEARKLGSCVAEDGDTSGQVKPLQVPAKCGPITSVQPPPTAAVASKCGSVSGPLKVLPSCQGHTASSSAVPVAVPGPQAASPSVVVITKVAPSGGLSANGQLQVTKPALSNVASMTQSTTPGRTVVINVPRTTAPQPMAVASRLALPASSHLPANIQIPPGMMLIRSNSGQLMLVSQQALAQPQQVPRVATTAPATVLSHQVSAAATAKRSEKVTVIRMAPPPTLQPTLIQKTAVVKVIDPAPKAAAVQTRRTVCELESQARTEATVNDTKKDPAATFSQETLESVKKCKNFLVTLIKLASSDSRSAFMANNVKGLVRSLLEGTLEAEEFTEQLYQELKSTPQPCLVPFLQKSLPAVRRLTLDPQLFIAQASTSNRNPNTLSSATTQSSTDTGPNLTTSQQGKLQPPRGVTLRLGLTTLDQSGNYICKSNKSNPKHTVVQSGKHFPGTFAVKQPFTQEPPLSATFASKDCAGGFYKEDDDINDVAFMAGVNLREENAQILTTMVGSVVQSCLDQPFLSPNLVLSQILHIGQALGVTNVDPEVIDLVSHATQECLRGLLERLTVVAEHRRTALKDDLQYSKVSDVRSQLRFMEEVESLNKKRKDDEEREKLLRLARSRSHTEDPQHQQLKQRAKELQQIEEAQLQKREANLTALAAIGPRRKRPVEQTESQVLLLSRLGVHRVTRVMLRDLLVCMEQDHFLHHSLTLYKAML